ncbi:MAG: hypothetical protein QOJ79_3281, partial [Actinomycetota bacterium]|nr:hypothetical protein [Actinomycetota bacterium]MDX6200130.1 hypothetical protein [Actinomycetota bacterium]
MVKTSDTVRTTAGSAGAHAVWCLAGS